MTTSKLNCREQLTAADFDFVASSLATANHQPSSPISSLLTEPLALDAALDSDRLLKRLLESPATIGISPQLYFYVLVRRMLGRFDREVADHIAGVLASFVKMDQRFYVTGTTTPIPYLTDMLIALQSASTEREFQIRVHIGNCSLFFAGVFPQHIQERERRRGAPDIGYYEEVGSTNYRLAANHRLAQQNALTDVYRTMADHFTEVRVGLNQMAEQMLCLESTP